MHFLAGMYKLRRTGPYMNYTDTKAKEQQEFCQKESSFLMIPSNLEGFTNKETTLHKACSGREVYCFKGDLALSEFDRTCPECGSRMHINGHRKLSLRQSLPLNRLLNRLRLMTSVSIRQLRSLWRMQALLQVMFSSLSSQLKLMTV